MSFICGFRTIAPMGWDLIFESIKHQSKITLVIIHEASPNLSVAAFSPSCQCKMEPAPFLPKATPFPITKISGIPTEQKPQPTDTRGGCGKLAIKMNKIQPTLF